MHFAFFRNLDTFHLINIHCILCKSLISLEKIRKCNILCILMINISKQNEKRDFLEYCLALILTRPIHWVFHEIEAIASWLMRSEKRIILILPNIPAWFLAKRVLEVFMSDIYVHIGWGRGRVAEVFRSREGPSSKSFDLEENFKP